MRPSQIAPLLLAAASLTLAAQPPAARDDEFAPIPQEKAPVKDLTPSELLLTLQHRIENETPGATMTFRAAVEQLQRALARKDKQLPIAIDQHAFREYAPDAPDIWEVEVKWPGVPQNPKVQEVLTNLIDQGPTRGATYSVRPGWIEITTRDAMTWNLMDTPVTVRFRERPLFLALEDLFEQTGIAINIDPRCAARMRVPISANFINVTLQDAIFVLIQTVDLRAVTLGRAVLITTPQNAYQIWWEQQLKSWLTFDPRAGTLP